MYKKNYDSYLLLKIENRTGGNIQLSNIDCARGRSCQCALCERHAHSPIGGRDSAIE